MFPPQNSKTNRNRPKPIQVYMSDKTLTQVLREFISKLNPFLDAEQKQRGLMGASLWEQVYYAVEDYNYAEENMEQPWYSFRDTFHENGNTFAWLDSARGTYRAAVIVNGDDSVTLGDPQAVTVSLIPTTQRTQVIRTDSGAATHLVSVSCTNALNRAHEIDSSELFLNMERRFDLLRKAHESDPTNYPLPRRNFMHDPTVQTGTVVMVRAEGNALVTMTRLDDTTLAQAEANAIANNPEYYGESIEFTALDWRSETLRVGDDTEIEIAINTDGEFTGLALCPLNQACAWFTRVQSDGTNRTKETERVMRESTKNLIAQVVGDAGATSFEQAVDELNLEIDRLADDGRIVKRTSETVASDNTETKAIADATDDSAESDASETVDAQAEADASEADDVTDADESEETDSAETGDDKTDADESEAFEVDMSDQTVIDAIASAVAANPDFINAITRAVAGSVQIDVDDTDIVQQVADNVIAQAEFTEAVASKVTADVTADLRRATSNQIDEAVGDLQRSLDGVRSALTKNKARIDANKASKQALADEIKKDLAPAPVARIKLTRSAQSQSAEYETGDDANNETANGGIDMLALSKQTMNGVKSRIHEAA